MKIPFFGKAPKAAGKKIPTLSPSQIVKSQNRTKAAADRVMSDDLNTIPPGLQSSHYDTIAELKRTVLKQSILINNRLESSRILVAVSFVVGGILTGICVGIQGQMSPDSRLQSSMSFLAGKISGGKTGFEIIQERQADVSRLKQQDRTIKDGAAEISRLGELTKLQDELISLNDFMMKGYREKISQLEERESWHVNTAKHVPLPLSAQQRNPVGETAPALHLRLADSLPVSRSRSANATLSQLSMVETIESVAVSRNIWVPRNPSVHLQTRMLHDDSIEVSISDTFTKKSKKFLVNPKSDTREAVAKKIDSALEKVMQ